jgi:pilus assembly protein TadC
MDDNALNEKEERAMYDLRKDIVIFKSNENIEICNQLKDGFQNAEVDLKEGKQTKITIKEGLWRGFEFVMADENQKKRVMSYNFFIPSFLATVIIFLVSVAAASIITSIIATIVFGEFFSTLMVGGIMGFALFSIVQKIFISNIKENWSPIVESALEKLCDVKSV